MTLDVKWEFGGSVTQVSDAEAELEADVPRTDVSASDFDMGWGTDCAEGDSDVAAVKLSIKVDDDASRVAVVEEYVVGDDDDTGVDPVVVAAVDDASTVVAVVKSS